MTPPAGGEEPGSRGEVGIIGTALRGVTRACGVCGQRRGLFEKWFTEVERCPKCNLKFDRVPGHFIGGVGVNTVVTFFLLAVWVVGSYVVRGVDASVTPVLIGALLLTIVFPVFFYPISKTFWTAIDLILRPATDDEFQS